MRALIQRVSTASVHVENSLIGEIQQGVLVFVCAMRNDTPEQATAMARKISKLRIFSDDTGRMNKSLQDINGAALIVSQFTLAGDTARGNRPGFSSAAAPEIGRGLYEKVAHELAALGISVSTGKFGADMKVSLINDGPVTLWIDL